MRRKFNGVLAALVVTTTTMAPALARGNDLIINDGFGEQVQVRHGFFGRDTKVVKDRLGDGFAEKRGLLGTQEKDVNVLGNSFRSSKGILGGTNLQGSDIFGDRMQTKRGIFGRRTTYVDVSGGASVVRNLWDQNKGKILGTNANSVLKSPLGALNGLGNSAMPPAGVPGVQAPELPGTPAPLNP
ncbi:MAG TPA: hypothetical protein V6D22_14595 [Candidatus Obscuribacterales bacterium]